MLERILVVSGVNGNELLKSLALNGQNTIGLRIVSPAELAQTSLLRAGVVLENPIVPTSEERLWMRRVMEKEIPTFKDVRSMTQAVHMLRRLAVGENEEADIRERLGNGIFKKKNDKLIGNYTAYKQLLADNGCIDTTDVIRKALTEGNTWESEFLTLSEKPLDPLSQALVNKVSDFSAREISVSELYGVGNPEKPKTVQAIRDCYGASAEVDTVLREIYESEKLDDCTIAVADTSYAQLLYDQALCYEIPMTFACGVSIQNTTPAKLFVRYYHWCQTGFGQDALSDMLHDSCFDWKKFSSLWQTETIDVKVLETVLRNVRFGTDAKRNAKKLSDLQQSLTEQAKIMNPESRDFEKLQKRINCLPLLEKLAKELALPSYEFIRKYTRIRQKVKSMTSLLMADLDKAAIGTVCHQLEILEKADVSEEDIFAYVMSLSIADGNSLPGSIQVVSVENAFETMRKKLYVVGLSSLKFPGGAKEDPLLLDDDLEKFTNAETYYADAKILKRKEAFEKLIALQYALGGRATLSFAEMNVAELKMENPSSVLPAFDNETEKIGYFENRLSCDRNVGQSYLQSDVQLVSEKVFSGDCEYDAEYALSKTYSPSALELFFQCPRRFCLKYLCGVGEQEETDPMEVISASDLGTLTHMLMETLVDETITKESFCSRAEQAFENYCREHPPVTNYEKEKEEFLDMMRKSFDLYEEHKGTVIAKEKETVCDHTPSGIHLTGYPDRVETRGSDSVFVVDYKTKRSFDHKKDDIDSCLQNVLYAYMLKHNGYDVAGTEYWYLRYGAVIPCGFDESMERKLDEKMEIFKNALETNSFPIADEKNQNTVCSYCQYGCVCGKAEGTVADT